jgi:hypothetical protein
VILSRRAAEIWALAKTMVIDFLVTHTFGRLAGVQALLDLLKAALPDSERLENEALRQIAEAQDWPFEEFAVQGHIIAEKFHFWLPRYTAYSVVTLLYGVLEAQLNACAERAYSEKKARFSPSDVRERGIEGSASYLRRVGVYDVRQDEAWPTLCDLRSLRNLIVHRVGAKGDTEQHRKTAERLAAKYRDDITFPNGLGPVYGEVWVSIPLCDRFIVIVEGVFDRVFDSIGLPPRYSRRLDPSAG